MALTVVEGDDMKTIQQLPLVLVDTLHLAVKHGVNIDSDPVVMLNIAS